MQTFQTVEIPSMKVQKKVKSMQMFRKPVDRILQVMNGTFTDPVSPASDIHAVMKIRRMKFV